MDDYDRDEHIKHVFRLLDDVSELLVDESKRRHGPSVEEIRHITHKLQEVTYSSHAQRLTHFILYLNSDLEHCSWVKNEEKLKQYIHSKLLPKDIYYNIVVIMNINSYMMETIMCTPYRFCRDLIEITLDIIKTMDCISQLTLSEDLVLALLKHVNQRSVECNLEVSLTSHFNQAMMVFGADYLPSDIRRLDFEKDRREIEKYNGYRLKSIFKLFVEITKYNISSEAKPQYDLYKSSSLFSIPTETDTVQVYKQYVDIVMYKCINMCDFSVDTWLSWYEVKDLSENTNLQSAIGHLCYELCTFIENGDVNEKFLHNYKPVLRNMAIEKVDYPDDIDEIIEFMDKNSKSHLNNLVKKLMENKEVFDHPHAINKLDNSMEHINYECFQFVVDQCMDHFKFSGNMFSTPLGIVLLHGIMYLDETDKISLLKHICTKYSDNDFQTSNDFTTELIDVVNNEHNRSVKPETLMSRLIWLVMQQPRKMLNLLITQRVNGLYGLRPKLLGSKKSCFDQVLAAMHSSMHVAIIIGEYFTWLDYPIKYSCLENKDNLYQWIVHATKNLCLIKPKKFLKHVLTPLLFPTSDVHHMLLLVNLTRFFFNECHLLVSSNIDVWDRLLIQFAQMLDKNRWSIDNYSQQKTELCENIIMTIQPLLNYGIYSGTPKEFGNIKKEVSSLHLITRAHFMCLWTSEYITIDGMEEQFIMTVHSKSHISYSNLNESSTQKAQEEFIFSIATYMPKFTIREMNSFIVNYLSSTTDETIVNASFFLWDSVMNASMRTVVYLKTARRSPVADVTAWDYLYNNLVNFIDASNGLRTNCIYKKEVDEKIKFNSLSKIVMVTRQMPHRHQIILLIVIRRLIESIFDKLDAEKITKMLNLIASLDTAMCKDNMGNIIDSLVTKLKALQSSLS